MQIMKDPSVVKKDNDIFDAKLDGHVSAYEEETWTILLGMLFG